MESMVHFFNNSRCPDTMHECKEIWISQVCFLVYKNIKHLIKKSFNFIENGTGWGKRGSQDLGQCQSCFGSKVKSESPKKDLGSISLTCYTQLLR